MRTLLAGELTTALAWDTDTYVKLEIQNGSGTWIDVGAALGSRWIVNATWKEHINTPIAEATFTLVRNIGTASLSPYMEGSALNVDDFAAYAPLLELGRLVRMSTATMDRGVALDTGKYRKQFDGRIDDIQQVDNGEGLTTITISCSDSGAWLMDMQIESGTTTYGSPGGTPLEDVLQAILDDNIPVGEPAVTLVKESSSNFAVTAYEQDETKVLEGLIKVTLDSTGEDVRYRYDSSHVSQLTWFDPDRSRVTVDQTITTYALQKLDASIADIRNAGELPYTDSVTSVPATVTSDDSASIAKYRRRFFRMPSTTIPMSSTEAQAVIDNVVNDLSGAQAEFAARCPYLWFVQLFDRYTFPANDRTYDTDQTLGVVSVQHTIEAGRGETLIEGAGRIVGAYAEWLKRVPKKSASLEVREEVTADTYLIYWSGDGVTVSIDGLGYATPSASPITVERPPATLTNVVTYSEQIDNTDWAVANCTISADAAIDPVTGDTTIELMSAVATSGSGTYVQQDVLTTEWDVGVTGDLDGTFSVVVRAYDANTPWVWLQYNNYAGGISNAWVDLVTGAVGTVTSGDSVRVYDLGSSWYRIALTCGRGAGSSTPSVLVGVSDADGGGAYTKTGTGEALYLGRAQLVTGIRAGTYVATTDSPVSVASEPIVYAFKNTLNGVTTSQSVVVQPIVDTTILPSIPIVTSYFSAGGAATISVKGVNNTQSFKVAYNKNGSAVTTSEVTAETAVNAVNGEATIAVTGTYAIDDVLNWRARAFSQPDGAGLQSELDAVGSATFSGTPLYFAAPSFQMPILSPTMDYTGPGHWSNADGSYEQPVGEDYLRGIPGPDAVSAYGCFAYLDLRNQIPAGSKVTAIELNAGWFVDDPIATDNIMLSLYEVGVVGSRMNVSVDYTFGQGYQTVSDSTYNGGWDGYIDAATIYKMGIEVGGFLPATAEGRFLWAKIFYIPPAVEVNNVSTTTVIGNVYNAPVTISSSGYDPLNPMTYGAVADGTTHPLSERYGNLTAAQAYYPFATALTQELDYCAIKKMSDLALGEEGSENGFTNASSNLPMYFPAGKYYLGADTWTIKNASGVHIFGDGRTASFIQGDDIVFQTDGLWFSRMEGLNIETTAGLTAVDIDGNVPGHAYATRGVQGNTFKDCLFKAGSSSDYAFVICRQGVSDGQGSENLFPNCHFEGNGTGQEALFWQYGFNALQNTFIGGNFQTYGKHAIKCSYGSMNIISVGFQSTKAYTQVTNSGYDIECSEGGSYTPITVTGCRTESLRFFHGASSQPGVLIGNQQFNGGLDWAASTAFALNDVTAQDAPSGKKRWYRVTTAGTSGGSEPTWPESSTVSDGSVVWTMTRIDVVHADSGNITLSGNSWWVGNVFLPDHIDGQPTKRVTTDYTASYDDEMIECDTTSGQIDIYLPIFGDDYPNSGRFGKRYYIKKTTADANAVRVRQDDGFANDAGSFPVIPGGTKGFMILEKGARADGTNSTYWIVSSSVLGFQPGDGGSVSQATSKSTGVTLNKPSGKVVTTADALAADTVVSFTLTNNTITTDDVLILNHLAGGTIGAYMLNAQCGSGSATINIRNVTAGSLSESIAISYVVVKGAIS